MSSLVRIEQGKQEPGVRRLHRLLRLYEIDPALAGDMLELEELVVELPEGNDLSVMLEEAVAYLEGGDFARGMAHLFSVRDRVPRDDATRLLRQRAKLTFALAARNLGKSRLAKRLIDELLCEPPAPELLVRTLIIEASLWFNLGSLEMALASIARAEVHIDGSDRKLACWLLHQKAKLLLHEGKFQESNAALEAALRIYDQLDDSYGRSKAMMLRIELLEARDGNERRALDCAREVLELARKCGFERISASAELELGRLLVKSGEEDEGVAALRTALGRAVLLGDKNTEFLAHFRLWKAYESLGDVDRATFQRDAACHFVSYVDEYLPEVAEVRRLLRDLGGPSCVTTPQDTS